MYHVLIIDDERYIVESLSELLLAQNDMDLDIMTAYFGGEALELLKTHKADLILMDIRMPGLSGIETAKKIREDWPLCHVIFLTGYASFEYIYEIEKMPNSTFLLKTEGSDTIVAAVQKAIAQMEEQTAHRQLVSKMERFQIQVKYLLYADLFRDLLSGRKLAELSDAIMQRSDTFLFDISKKLCVFYMKVRWLKTSAFQGDFHRRIANITGFLYHQLNDKYNIALVDVDMDTFVVFLQPCVDTQISMHSRHINYICECLNDCVSTLSDSQFLLLAREQEVDWDEIASSYGFYNRYYLQSVLPGFPQYGQIIICRDDKAEQQPRNNFINAQAFEQEYLRRLSLGLHDSDKTAIQKALDHFLSVFAETTSMHHLAAVRLYHKISDLFIEYIMQYNLSETISQKINLGSLYNLNQIRSWSELISYYRALASVLARTVTIEENDSRKRIITQIQTYIKNNLHHNLTLTEVANVTNYNSVYVSRLFKQMTGDNLFQYIVEVKVEKAKEYLTKSSESIQQIAEKLGYGSSQYFSSVFKKQTGFSPRDYRNQSI